MHSLCLASPTHTGVKAMPTPSTEELHRCPGAGSQQALCAVRPAVGSQGRGAEEGERVESGNALNKQNGAAWSELADIFIHMVKYTSHETSQLKHVLVCRSVHSHCLQPASSPMSRTFHLPKLKLCPHVKHWPPSSLPSAPGKHLLLPVSMNLPLRCLLYLEWKHEISGSL